MSGDGEAGERPAGSRGFLSRPRIRARPGFYGLGDGVAVLLSCFLVLCVTSARQKSATWDETHYLGAGNFALKTHHFDLADIAGCIPSCGPSGTIFPCW